jgi:hypothetical protein
LDFLFTPLHNENARLWHGSHSLHVRAVISIKKNIKICVTFSIEMPDAVSIGFVVALFVLFAGMFICIVRHHYRMQQIEQEDYLLAHN